MNNELPNPDKDEVIKLRATLARYRAILEVLAMEPWEDMTPEELNREINEAKSIDDIISSLEQVQAA